MQRQLSPAPHFARQLKSGDVAGAVRMRHHGFERSGSNGIQRMEAVARMDECFASGDLAPSVHPLISCSRCAVGTVLPMQTQCIMQWTHRMLWISGVICQTCVASRTSLNWGSAAGWWFRRWHATLSFAGSSGGFEKTPVTYVPHIVGEVAIIRPLALHQGPVSVSSVSEERRLLEVKQR